MAKAESVPPKNNSYPSLDSSQVFFREMTKMKNDQQAQTNMTSEKVKISIFLEVTNVRNIIVSY